MSFPVKLVEFECPQDITHLVFM